MKFLWLVAAGIALLALAHSTSAQAVNFTSCQDAGNSSALSGTLCATFREPARARGSEIGVAEAVVHLFVRKFPATGKLKGTLWLVSGGPGESGATFYPFLKTLRAAFPGFELLIPDPRGTGFSTRL